MRFPSKVTPYRDSIISKFPVVLEKLEQQSMTPQNLFSKIKGAKISDINEFVDILDCLYALNVIELREGVLHYVAERSVR